KDGWTTEQEECLVHWFLNTQQGWFAEFSGKGVQFPEFWATTLNEFVSHHGTALLQDLSQIDASSKLGGLVVNLLAQSPKNGESLMALYHPNGKPEAKIKVIKALRKVP